MNTLMKKTIDYGVNHLRGFEKSVKFHNKWHYASSFLKRFPQRDLTQSQKDEIKDYWAGFGLRLPDYSWHQMYYGVTGIFSPYFIPDPFMGYLVYPLLNRKEYVPGWDDKNLYQSLCPCIKFPDDICHIVKGRVYDSHWNFVPQDRDALTSFAKSCMSANGEDVVFLKKSTATFAGKGVKKVSLQSVEDLVRLLSDPGNADCVVQRPIKQHAFFRQFNESSVNILRINTWNKGDEVVVLSVSVRFGMKGASTDISFVNGEEIVFCAGVDNKGVLNGKFCDLSGNIKKPDGIKLLEVPQMGGVISSVKEAHKCLKLFDIVGWDVTINENGTPVCIEYNIDWPGTIIYQFANGPFAGSYSEDFIRYVSEHLDKADPLIAKKFKLR